MKEPDFLCWLETGGFVNLAQQASQQNSFVCSLQWCMIHLLSSHCIFAVHISVRERNSAVPSEQAEYFAHKDVACQFVFHSTHFCTGKEFSGKGWSAPPATAALCLLIFMEVWSCKVSICQVPCLCRVSCLCRLPCLCRVLSSGHSVKIVELGKSRFAVVQPCSCCCKSQPPAVSQPKEW